MRSIFVPGIRPASNFNTKPQSTSELPGDPRIERRHDANDCVYSVVPAAMATGSSSEVAFADGKVHTIQSSQSIDEITAPLRAEMLRIGLSDCHSANGSRIAQLVSVYVRNICARMRLAVPFFHHIAS